MARPAGASVNRGGAAPHAYTNLRRLPTTEAGGTRRSGGVDATYRRWLCTPIAGAWAARARARRARAMRPVRRHHLQPCQSRLPSRRRRPRPSRRNPVRPLPPRNSSPRMPAPPPPKLPTGHLPQSVDGPRPPLPQRNAARASFPARRCASSASTGGPKDCQRSRRRTAVCALLNGACARPRRAGRPLPSPRKGLPLRRKTRRAGRKARAGAHPTGAPRVAGCVAARARRRFHRCQAVGGAPSDPRPERSGPLTLTARRRKIRPIGLQPRMGPGID